MILDSIKRRFISRFDLRHDQAHSAEIDYTFRSGVEFRGTNLWVLIFAILVASIGLNVNSTAVVIGAMLISPLMGPIMALGYGAGINDSALMKKSIFNLGLAAVLSLIASTLYFLISPLSQAHSELLARTTPTIWDVLIALFGGLAGVIGVTRKVKSNLIPGVAIATALMPPLCTAGYGLAVGNWQFFIGAFYLFTINCVFIAIATLMMIRLMSLPSVKILEEKNLLKRRTIIGFIIFSTIVPSLFLAFDLVHKEYFESSVNRFIQVSFKNNTNILVLSQDIDYRKKQVKLTLAGNRLSENEINTIKNRLEEFGLTKTELIVMQSSPTTPDINLVKKDILNEFLINNKQEIQNKDEKIDSLQSELMSLKQSSNIQGLLKSLQQELLAQFPTASEINITKGISSSTDDNSDFFLVQIKLKQKISNPEKERLKAGLQVRIGIENTKNLRLEFSQP